MLWVALEAYWIPTIIRSPPRTRENRNWRRESYFLSVNFLIAPYSFSFAVLLRSLHSPSPYSRSLNRINRSQCSGWAATVLNVSIKLFEILIQFHCILFNITFWFLILMSIFLKNMLFVFLAFDVSISCHYQDLRFIHFYSDFFLIIVAQFWIVKLSNHSGISLHGLTESRLERVLSNYSSLIRSKLQRFESWPNSCLDLLIMVSFCLAQLVHTSNTSPWFGELWWSEVANSFAIFFGNIPTNLHLWIN